MLQEDLERRLRRVLSEAARRDLRETDVEADLVEVLGLDSLAALRLLAAVEKRFEVRFPDERLGEFRTLGQLCDFLAHAAKEKGS